MDLDDFQAYIAAAKAGDVSTLQYYTKYYRKATQSGVTALMLAASQGHVNAVRLLAQYEVTMRDKNGYTALMYSIENGSMEVFECLASEVGIAADSGATALEIAMQHRKYKLAELLYPIEREKAGVTPLMWESFTGNISGIQQCLEYAKYKTAIGMTALMFSAISGHVECAKLVARYELKMQANNGNTALMFASINNHSDVAILLLKEVGMRDKKHLTALIKASQKGFADIVNILGKYEAQHVDDNDQTALMFAASSKAVSQSASLIPRISKWTNGEGRTALMISSIFGDLEGARLLIPKEKKMKDNKGMTALMFAAREGHVEIVSELIEYEAGQQCEAGGTALMLAVKENHKDVVELLIDREAGIQDNMGTTALITAVEAGLVDLTALLFPKEKNIMRKDGSTALMTAIQSDDIRLVNLCMEQAGMKTNFENTALNIAIQSAFYRSAEILMKSSKERELIGLTDLMVAAFYGDIASVKKYAPMQKMEQDKYQRTALMYAAMRGNTACIEYLIEEEAQLDINGWTADVYSSRHFHDDFTAKLRALLDS